VTAQKIDKAMTHIETTAEAKYSAPVLKNILKGALKVIDIIGADKRKKTGALSRAINAKMPETKKTIKWNKLILFPEIMKPNNPKTTKEK
jgi:hypothetical protein